MALIEARHINTLFSELQQYGLRGNSALWEVLKQVLKQQQSSFTASSLLDWVDDYVDQLISNSGQQNKMLEMDEFYIEELNLGGMSGGVFSLNVWNDNMRPILIKRCDELEQGLLFREREDINRLIFIGDVHGRIDKLEAFLDDQDVDSSDSKLVFVGDLIDNEINSEANHIGLLQRVKNLVDEKSAYCLLGNHEFNAIGWSLPKGDGTYCRDRNNEGNKKQHRMFLEQVGEDSLEYQKWIAWFKTLPLFLDFGDIKTIHACWHDASLLSLKPYLNPDNSLKSDHWQSAFDKQHQLYSLIETLLKGPEVRLPENCSFFDKNEKERHNIRVAWWKDVCSVNTYRDIAMVPEHQRMTIPNEVLLKDATDYNSEPLFPVVVGHYTLDPTPFPEHLNKKVVCVDFNAAKGGNPLVGFYTNLDSYDDCPSELTEYFGFAYANEIGADRVVSNGVLNHINATIKALPERPISKAYARGVKEILLKNWDPIGIFDPDYPDEELSDEYTAYEDDVAKLALDNQSDTLAAYLVLVEQHVVGVDREDVHRRCAITAHKLIQST